MNLPTITSPILVLILCLASPLVSLAGDPVHLFLLSGQSNMANLKPEEVFTPAVEAHFGKDKVVVVKVAQRGQPIRRWYKGWKVTGDQDPDKVGDLYDRLLKEAKSAMNGKSIQSVTFIWMQGERDAKERLAGLYEEAFLGVLEQLKSDLEVDELNYIIGRLSDWGLGQEEWDKIREIQQKLGEAGPNSAWVDTDDLNDDVKTRDGTPLRGGNDLHYSKEGYKIIAERYVETVKKIVKQPIP